MSYSQSRLWMVAILPVMAAFFIFVTSLTQTALWADEGWTVAATASANPITITEWTVQDVHPPLYFMALSVWRLFTGDSVFELRYFSVLVTLLGVALVYRIGTQMFNHRAGFVAAVLYALHDQVKVLTQEVRHYPGQLTMTVLVLWLYWRFQQKPSARRGLWFVVGGVAALYVHYWTAFILLACGLHALIVHFRQRRILYRVMAAGVAMGAVFALWLPALIRQITLERPQGLPHALENTNYVYRVLMYQLLGTPEALWLVLMAAGTVGAWAFIPRRWWPSSASGLLLLAVIVPPALTLAMNAFYPILSFRALAVIVPPAVLLAAYGLSRFRTPELSVMMAFIVFFSLTNTAAGAIFRLDWPGLAHSISTRSTLRDVLLLENYLGAHTLSYYLDEAERGTAYAYTEHIRTFYAQDYDAYLADALNDVDGVWVSKSGWPGLTYDIRPTLTALGFVETMPEDLQDRDTPLLLWRFDRAPQGQPRVTYGAELALHRANVALNRDVITVNMLWQAQTAPTQEYTVSILLFGPDGIRNQDSRPLNGESPTSTWDAGELYFDSHQIDADTFAPGVYRVAVQVYSFTDGTFTQTQNALTDDCTDDAECRFIFVGDFILP